MIINPNISNVAQQTYSKSANSNADGKSTNTEEKSNEAISLNINSSKEISTSNDLDTIKQKVQEREKQLNVDFAKESSSFSKDNITSQEGSLSNSQSSNIKNSAYKLLS